MLITVLTMIKISTTGVRPPAVRWWVGAVSRCAPDLDLPVVQCTPLDEEEEDHPVKGDHCFDNGFVWQKQFAHTNILIEQKKTATLNSD